MNFAPEMDGSFGYGPIDQLQQFDQPNYMQINSMAQMQAIGGVGGFGGGHDPNMYLNG